MESMGRRLRSIVEERGGVGLELPRCIDALSFFPSAEIKIDTPFVLVDRRGASRPRAPLQFHKQLPRVERQHRCTRIFLLSSEFDAPSRT